MRMPRAVNSLIDDLFERKYRKVGHEKNNLKKSQFFFFFFKMVPLIFLGVQDGNRVITVYALSRGEY